MNLFIDSISNPGAIILFEKEQDFFSQKSIDIALNESSKLIGYINTFLEDSQYSIFDIKNIVVINGPGSFTGVRTTVLIANTFAFRSNITLTPLSYFDLYNNYPIIKKSSKRDVFIKKSKNGVIKILGNSQCIKYICENNIQNIYGDFDISKNITIVEEQSKQSGESLDILLFQDSVNIMKKIDYKNLIFGIKLKNKKQIEPLYIKKPNIN